jgi:hypothetical protein
MVPDSDDEVVFVCAASPGAPQKISRAPIHSHLIFSPRTCLDPDVPANVTGGHHNETYIAVRERLAKKARGARVTAYR